MKISLLSLFALSIVLGGCGAHSHFGIWNAENRERDTYWNMAFQDGKVIPGPAMVMPLIDCTKSDTVASSEQVRKLWNLTFSKEIWKRLKQSGEPKITKRAEAETFCAELTKEVNAEDWEYSAVLKDEIARAMAKDPSKKSLAIALWMPVIYWQDLGYGKRRAYPIADVETRVFLFSAQGETIFRAVNICGRGFGDGQVTDAGLCDANFKQATSVSEFMFKWFPRNVLGGA